MRTISWRSTGRFLLVLAAVSDLLNRAGGPVPRAADSSSGTVASGGIPSLLAESSKLPTAWNRLRSLTDGVGARLSGSPAEPLAVVWAKREFERDGLKSRLEPVIVPVWVRGKESAEMLEPGRQPLVLLGLGGTVATPPDGITAPVVVVGSYEELDRLPREAVAGKIVLFDNPFIRTGDEGHDYGEAVTFRSGGAVAAAKKGAAACLVRSVATATLRTPHTGGFRYEEGVRQIPAAAVTIEDAKLIRRLTEAGHEVRVRMFLGAHREPDREGANVVAEIRGRELPNEIVLIAAHLDSWDVGAGAIDDGAGCAIVLETMRLLAAGPPPRRTVRAVLYANEENGLRGGIAYAESHREELARHVAALEADAGGARALGITVDSGPGGVEMLRDLVTPALATFGAGRIRAGEGGADISKLGPAGVPLMALDQDMTHYFDWHHSMADTLDKIEPGELQKATAVFAAATWLLAESPKTLPRKPPESK